MRYLLFTVCLLLNVTTFAVDYNGAKKEFNDEISFYWGKTYQSFLKGMDFRIKEILPQLRETDLGTELKLEDIKIKKINFKTSPKIDQISDTQFKVDFPPNSNWSTTLQITLRVRVPLFGNWRTEKIFLTIKNIKGYFSMSYEEVSTGRFDLHSVSAKVTNFEIDIESPGLILDLILSALNTRANDLAQDFVDDLTKSITAKSILEDKDKFAFQVYGLGKPQKSEMQNYDFKLWETIATNIDEKVMREHFPYGASLVLPVLNKKVQDGTWLDDFQTPYHSKGQVVDYEAYGDSAIWTGHYLAAQSFRHAVNKDNQSLRNIKRLVKGIKRLFLVNGNTGLLARSAFPLNTKIGQELYKKGRAYRTTEIEGQKWISFQGSGGISRDQNLGVLFGLITAYKLIGSKDLYVKETTRELILLLTDYLIKNKWLITEDQRMLGKPGEPGLGTYFGLANKIKITILMMAEHVSLNPSKYQEEIKKAAKSAELAWFPMWLSNANPMESYYKYNLSYITFYSYFLVEEDPVRKSNLEKSFNVLKAYTSHHENPHFDLIKLANKLRDINKIKPTVLNSLNSYLNRYHRGSGNYNPDMTNVLWSGRDYPGKKGLKLPKFPLESEQRDYSEWFIWQRDPFKAVHTHKNKFDFIESSGIDFSLPFWMAKYYQVIP